MQDIIVVKNINKGIIMDERLKDINLVDELDFTFLEVENQLTEDEKRYGDIWKKHGLVFNDQSQEVRWFYKMRDYFEDYMNEGVPIPWTKVIGEAHICLVREKKLKEIE